ncbi:MAG: dihydrolipoyl dehydrogenase [Bacillaceae bacterium]|nr:MAG: dihydrolipoyl dehydrogenase [Bacillaceae bacterium]
MAKEYDVVILGGGTAGYVTAIRASQLGMKTAIVEKSKLGGTCLHSGCIPSKVLLRSAEIFAQSKKSSDFGIELSNVQVNFDKVQERKEKIVSQLYQGVRQLVKKGKIDVFHGIGRILGASIFSPQPGTVSVEMENGEENQILLPKYVIIATGSRPHELPGLTIDGETILTSDEALQLQRLPSSMIIVGGGVIGMEWASMLSDFGVEVTILEMADRILPSEDIEISKEMERLMRKKGVRIFTNISILPEKTEIQNGITVFIEQDGQEISLHSEKLLLSIGRKGNTEGIGLENTEIEIHNGYIVTNEFYQTKESNIYAVGDVIGGLQLAHVASQEGIRAVEHIAGENVLPIDYKKVPKCIYSNPAAASIGLTEQEAREKGYTVKIGKFPFQGVGKALIYGEPQGFVKIVADEKTDDLLGIHIIGPNATELISEGSLASFLDASSWELSRTIHAHPTLSEGIMEAALAVNGKAIHI